MSATGQTLGPTQSEIVSPELVLVDPRLAKDARARLSGLDDTAALVHEASQDSTELSLHAESVATGSASDEEIAAARRRLTESSELEPPKRRNLRLLVVTLLRRRGAPSAV